MLKIQSSSFYKLLIFIFLAFLSACGSSGGSSTSDALGDGSNDVPPAAQPPAGQPPASQPPAAAADTGSVSVLITDAPSAAFSQILVTFTCAKLLGDQDGQITIFEGVETFDLLGLRETSELFVTNPSVPAGHYSKLRLCVREIELIKRDDRGVIVERQQARVLGGGKLDLLPRGGFEVMGGRSLLVELDWDAEKSLKLHGKGPDRFSLRPVVFVRMRLGELPPRDKLLRFGGVVENLERDIGRFDLCGTHFEQEHETALQPLTDDHDPRDGVRRGCVGVDVGDATSIFAESGDPVGLDDVFNGDEATVFGRALRAVPLDESPDDSRYGSILQVEAMLIELGARGTFARLSGTAAGGVDADDRFPFDLDGGQGFAAATRIPVRLVADANVPGTKIVDRLGRRLPPDAIVEGERLLLRGVIELDPNLVNASMVVVGARAGSQPELTGEILDVEDDGSGLRLLLADGSAERCVLIGEQTEVYMITEEEGRGTAEIVDPDDSLVGLQADIFGHEDNGGCFAAGTVIAFEAPEATPL